MRAVSRALAPIVCMARLADFADIRLALAYTGHVVDRFARGEECLDRADVFAVRAGVRAEASRSTSENQNAIRIRKPIRPPSCLPAFYRGTVSHSLPQHIAKQPKGGLHAETNIRGKFDSNFSDSGLRSNWPKMTPGALTIRSSSKLLIWHRFW